MLAVGLILVGVKDAALWLLAMNDNRNSI